ncbi:unnamed protein product [Caretta caretta]
MPEKPLRGNLLHASLDTCWHPTPGKDKPARVHDKEPALQGHVLRISLALPVHIKPTTGAACTHTAPLPSEQSQNWPKTRTDRKPPEIPRREAGICNCFCYRLE